MREFKESMHLRYGAKRWTENQPDGDMDMVEEKKAEGKPATRSKVNWAGLAMVVMGMISDPSFQIFFGDLIPQAWLPRILFLSGWAVIGLRTLGTTQPVTLNWKMPWSGK